MTRRKFLIFAALTATATAGLLIIGLLGADVYLHHRAERSAGVNRWGYRGPVAGGKRPGEWRVAVLGGSTVFGYGVRWDEALPRQLEVALNRRAAGAWSVVNLGYNTEGAFAFRVNLEDFAFLDYDIVCLYEGYNDMIGDGSPNLVVVRHRSPVFRLTGYFPILPLVFREKAMALRSGDIGAAYEAQRNPPQTVFRPSVADRTSAMALDAAANVASSLEKQLGHLSDEIVRPGAHDARGCATPWTFYCDAYYRAIEYAIRNGQQVLVASQPRLASPDVDERHQSQQAELRAMIARHFGGRRDVAYLDLRNSVDLSNDQLSFDRMHLTADGNQIVAGAMTAAIDALRAR